MVIASIAEANNCVLVTDNEKHFPDMDILNPLRHVERGDTPQA